MSEIPADMGGRLRYLRESAGLSPERVALEIGLSARAVGDWERNYRTPRLVYLRRLAPSTASRLPPWSTPRQFPKKSTPRQFPKKLPPVSPEQIHAKVARTRAEQGLPPTITDPASLERVASIFRLTAPSEPEMPKPRKHRHRPQVSVSDLPPAA